MEVNAERTKRMRYPIPAATHRVEEEINRSRFITTVGYTPTVVAARRISRHCQRPVCGCQP